MANRRAPILFISLLALIVVSPITIELGGSGLLVSALWTFVIMACVASASDKRTQAIPAAGFAILWIILTFVPLPISPVVAPLTAFCLLGFTIVVSLKKILSAKSIDLNMISAALAIYLLIGMSWTGLYQAIYLINDKAFLLPSLEPSYVVVDLMYFSLVTLTTLGYGDILPLSPTAKIFAATEAVTGALYLAVLVARLVSLYKED